MDKKLTQLLGVCLAGTSLYFTTRGLTEICGTDPAIITTAVLIQLAYYRAMTLSQRGWQAKVKTLAFVAALYLLNSAGNFAFLKGNFDERWTQVSAAQAQVERIDDTLKTEQARFQKLDTLVQQETARGGVGPIARGYMAQRSEIASHIEGLKIQRVDAESAVAAAGARFAWLGQLADLAGVSMQTLALGIIALFAFAVDIAAGLMLGSTRKKVSYKTVTEVKEEVEEVIVKKTIIEPRTVRVESAASPTRPRRNGKSKGRQALGRGLDALLNPTAGSPSFTPAPGVN